jgi:hypothetical protein
MQETQQDCSSLLKKQSEMSSASVSIKVLTAMMFLNFSTVMPFGGATGSLACSSMSNVRFCMDSSIQPKRQDISAAITYGNAIPGAEEDSKETR